MFSSTPRTFAQLLASAALLLAACADPECPEGSYKVGSFCRRVDAGSEAVGAGEGGTGTSNEAGTVTTTSDGGSSSQLIDATTPLGPIAPGPNMSAGDASTVVTGNDASMASTTPDGGTAMTAGPECDATHACAAGFVCTAMKCVSACTQTQCDPNATCSLVANAPVCACNRGFIAMAGSGGAVTCLKDVACEELGCDVNAECKVVAQVRQCACKNGYTGNGKMCSALECGPLVVPNGTVTVAGGATTYGAVATVRCSTGYALPPFSSTTRKCDVSNQVATWSGTAPVCSIVDCGTPPRASANGTVVAVQTTYNAQATYTCATGFEPKMSTLSCRADGSWSGSAPTCAATCGNGKRDDSSAEQCDLSVAGTSPWTCNNQCVRVTAYALCSSALPCGPGELCGPHGACAPRCSVTSDCPAIPAGPTVKVCAGGGCLVTQCNSSRDCAPGLKCYFSSGGTLGMCNSCTMGVEGGQCL